MNTSYNQVEVLRHDLKILATELDGGRSRRVAAVSEFIAMEYGAYDGETLHDAAYELRSMVAEALGYKVADEDEDEDMVGIPAIEAFVCLSRVYGPDWARLAYVDYLEHVSATPCREPQAVATAVLNRASHDYQAAAESFLKAA